MTLHPDSFDLIQQPWIPVMTHDFQVQEVSLIELFETWETVREIQADNPPTTLALYRLLLAILHRTYEGPQNEDHWEEIFEDNGEKAIAYLQRQGDRFDLLHPEYPFMQDPILPLDKAVPVYAIHTMSTSHVFSHEHEWSGYSITLPQGARLLVRLQGVDITSLRAFYVGQSSGNRSAVNTPTINAANVLIQGSTLKHTLLFNLVRYDPEASYPSEVTGDDWPAWETSYAGQPKKTVPKGYISYLTFPWRRLRLFVEDNAISQIAITMGDSLTDKVSPQQWECGVAYQEDKPVRLNLSKQLWRDADCFILSAEKNYRPRVVDWLSELKFEDLVEDIVTLQVTGFSADKAKPLGWSWEKFSAPRQYITEEQLAVVLKLAISTAKEHQQVFKAFRGSPYFALAEILKGDASSLAAALDGESRYWAALDRKFPELLEALPQDSQTDADGIIRYGHQALPDWTQTVQALARQAFTDSIQSIRNYQARAAALRALEWKLAELRLEPEEKAARKEKAAAKKKEKVTK
jgi:CRISPR system Cascade subunit CasA